MNCLVYYTIIIIKLFYNDEKLFRKY